MCDGATNAPLGDDLAAARAGFSDTAQKVFTNADRYVGQALIGFAEGIGRRARG